MAEKKISLRDLRFHIRELDRLLTEAWFTTDAPAAISFADVRKHAVAITALVADDSNSPHAATTRSPAAADNDKATARERAAYGQAAADKKPVDVSAVLGLSHIRRS